MSYLAGKIAWGSRCKHYVQGLQLFVLLRTNVVTFLFSFQHAQKVCVFRYNSWRNIYKLIIFRSFSSSTKPCCIKKCRTFPRGRLINPKSSRDLCPAFSYGISCNGESQDFIIPICFVWFYSSPFHLLVCRINEMKSHAKCINERWLSAAFRP